MKVKSESEVAQSSMGFSRQKYWSGVPLPSPIIHLMGNKLEISVLLDKGHKMIMLMAEDKPPWTKYVDLPKINPNIWAQGQVGQAVRAI